MPTPCSRATDVARPATDEHKHTMKQIPSPIALHGNDGGGDGGDGDEGGDGDDNGGGGGGGSDDINVDAKSAVTKTKHQKPRKPQSQYATGCLPYDIRQAIPHTTSDWKCRLPLALTCASRGHGCAGTPCACRLSPSRLATDASTMCQGLSFSAPH